MKGIPKMNKERVKQQSRAKTVVPIVVLLMVTIILSTAYINDAQADNTHRTHTILLSAELNDTTITVNQYDTIIFDNNYREWHGGWFNTKYSEKYILGTRTTSGHFGGIIEGVTIDVPTLTNNTGVATIPFYYAMYDHGLFNNQEPRNIKEYEFKLDVRESKTVTYKSNTTDFKYDWNDKFRFDGQATVRNVSNAMTNHDFVGWNTEANGTGIWYQPGNKISSSATLYAQWRPELTVTSESSVILDKGNNIDYTVTANQTGVNIKFIDKTQVPSLNMSNGKITGIVDNEPGKYSVKIQLEKGLQKTDFWLTIYVKIYEIEPIDEFAYTGESWTRNIELMPNNVTYKLTYGSISRTYNGETETISSTVAGLSNISGTTVSGIFPSPGTYLINITVTAPNNPELKSTSVQMKVLVADPEPTVFPPTFDRIIVIRSHIPDTYDFYVKDPQNYLQISWNFGDGKSSTGQSTVHHYDYPGNYQWTVTLKAFDGFNDVVQSGYVMSKGPEEIPIDSWVDVRYAVMVEAPFTSLFVGPDFLSGEIIFDSVSGKSYMLVSGTPDAENWADKTGITYDVKIMDGTNVIKSWQINLHGGTSDIPISSFVVEVSNHTVTATYLGNKNSVVYIAWDGKNYTRLSGVSGSYEFEETGTYVCPVIVTLAGTQISDTIAFEIRTPESIRVSLDTIHDATVYLGNDFNIPLILHPFGATAVISGADWIHYEDGRIKGTPKEVGTYEILIYAEYGTHVSEIQSFSITVIEEDPGLSPSIEKGIQIVHILLIVIGILAVLTFITRAIRYGLATAIISMFYLGVLI